MREEAVGLSVFLVVLIFSTIFGGTVGSIDYEYEVRECKEMTGEESAFNFDKDIQLNAQYDSHCRYVNTHPFAKIGNIVGGSILGLLLGLIPSMILGMIFYKLVER